MTVLYRFDGFLLNPATRELLHNGALAILPARAFECLAYLIEHRDRAVGRDELIAAVWGRIEVSDALLSHTVVRIRRLLGDTGNAQRTIRTVPRFGYRWVGAIEVEAPAVVETMDAREEIALAIIPATDPTFASDAAEVAVASDSAPVDESVTTSCARGRWRRYRIAWVLLALAGAMVLVATFMHQAYQQPETAVSVVAPARDGEIAAPALTAPALVLPAEVKASGDWRWLRLGLMDLVANRLRSGALYTVPSESVVGLLKQRVAANGDELLHDPGLAAVANLRVLPRVHLDGDQWSVRLDASGAQRSLSVEAHAADPIGAGRAAADLLLRKLGLTPAVGGAEPLSPALAELLQRAGAAMLADQLGQAQALIEKAPADLQREPHVQQRMAQIELRAGEYQSVETRLRVALDVPAVSHDAALHARMLITLAAAYVRQNQFDKADELYQEAIAQQRGTSDPEALGIAHLGHGIVLAQQDRLDDAVAELSRARVDLESVGDGLGVAGVDVNLGDFELMRHRPAAALPIFGSALRQFDQLGAREGLAYALTRTALAQLELLDVSAALATTQRFWPPEAHTSNQRLRWTLTQTRARALLAVGRLDEADTLISRIRAESDPRKDATARAQADALAARIAMLRGDAASTAGFAAAALLPALRDADATLYTRTLLLRAQALRDTHDSAAAAATLDALYGLAEAAHDDWRSMYATLGRAEQTWADGKREAAFDEFAIAMKAAGHFGVPEDLVAAAAPYVTALIDASRLDDARAIAGRIAPWADVDARAASTQLQLFRAMGQDVAARKAQSTLQRLKVDRPSTAAPDVR
jgi:DNA-binding winged helix-turn-helix (wHTH) protein/tetratricopeptide (TPR) repeat protein